VKRKIGSNLDARRSFHWEQAIVIVLVLAVVIYSVFRFVTYSLGKGAYISSVADGDTIVLQNGKEVGLLGINTSENGQDNSNISREYLLALIDKRKIWLEYDGFRRDSAWVWVGCENEPRFLYSKFFVKEREIDGAGLRQNPVGCWEGVLVNEQIIKMGWSK